MQFESVLVLQLLPSTPGQWVMKKKLCAEYKGKKFICCRGKKKDRVYCIYMDSLAAAASRVANRLGKTANRALLSLSPRNRFYAMNARESREIIRQTREFKRE